MKEATGSGGSGNVFIIKFSVCVSSFSFLLDFSAFPYEDKKKINFNEFTLLMLKRVFDAMKGKRN